jgi:hypothetical protein
VTLPVLLRPEAQDNLLSSREWYDERGPGLGDRFMAAVSEAIR